MGGTQSKVTTDVANKAITDFTMSLAQECAAGASNAVAFKFKDVGGDFNFSNVNVDQTATVNFSCIQETMSEVEISQKMAAFLSQQSQTKGNPLALPWSGVDSETNAKLYNEVVQKLNMEDIKKCAASAANTFLVEAGNTGGNVNIQNVDIKQLAKVISECKQISEMSAKLASEINSKVQQDSTTTMPSFLEGLFGDFGPFIVGGGMLISCCCMLLVIGAIVLFWMNRPQSAGEMIMESVSGGDS